MILYVHRGRRRRRRRRRWKSASMRYIFKYKLYIKKNSKQRNEESDDEVTIYRRALVSPWLATHHWTLLAPWHRLWELKRAVLIKNKKESKDLQKRTRKGVKTMSNRATITRRGGLSGFFFSFSSERRAFVEWIDSFSPDKLIPSPTTWSSLAGKRRGD